MNSKKETIDELLTFVAHAAGLKALYMPTVNKLYYALKRSHLREKETLNAFDQLKRLINDALVETTTLSFAAMQAFVKKSISKKSDETADKATPNIIH